MLLCHLRILLNGDFLGLFFSVNSIARTHRVNGESFGVVGKSRAIPQVVLYTHTKAVPYITLRIHSARAILLLCASSPSV